MRPGLIVLVCGAALGALATAPDARALAPDAAARGFREGANHHLGDDSFVATFGRAPTAADSEELRMYTHLVYVHAWLASRPATHPDHAARREALLGYLGDYIVQRTTPLNEVLPWRNPVFIDAHDNICAVGYLIERSAGLALPELIRATSPHAYLEDIDAPGVAAWIATSGFTLEELASIQPGYLGPMVLQHYWGPVREALPDDVTDGALVRGHKDGAWRLERADGFRGEGTFTMGRGAWRGYVGDTLVAEGPYRADAPHGAWRLYHRSGRLAAEGRFAAGVRVGRWTFYHDAEGSPVAARGRFARDGWVTGTWEHLAADGEPVATTRYLGGAWDEVQRRVFPHLLLERARGDVRLRVVDDIYVAQVGGHRFMALPGAYHMAPCASDDTRWFDADGWAWEPAEGAPGQWRRGAERLIGPLRRALRRGDLDALVEAKSRIYDAPLVEPATASRPASATLVGAFHDALGSTCEAGPAAADWMLRPLQPWRGTDDAAPHLSHFELLAADSGTDFEWRHIDGLFEQAFLTLPDYQI